MADGPIIVIMLQHANYGHGQTVHSEGQMGYFGVIIDNKSCNAGGKQCIITPEGYTIPIHVHNGLSHMEMKIPVDATMDKYPHIFLMADSPWDPLTLDKSLKKSSMTQLQNCLR